MSSAFTPVTATTTLSQPPHSSISIISVTPSAIDVPQTLTTPPHFVPIVVSVSVIGVMLFLLVLILMVVIIKYRLHHVQNNACESKEKSNLPQVSVVKNGHINRWYENEIRNNMLSSPIQATSTVPYVPLIFSQNTPHSDQDLIRCYGSKLNKTVTVRMYDAADRLSRTAWLEQNYGEAAAILCICNKAFAMEWSNSSTFTGGSIVSAVKMIVQGQIEHQTVPGKFAALFIYEEDKELTPPYLKNVKSFKLCLENIEPISRFALSVNEYKY